MNAFIYIVINIINGHHYIGGTKRLNDRWGEHRNELRQNKHHSSRLQNAWNKYGEDNFSFQVLAQVTPGVRDYVEGALLQSFPCEYNIDRDVRLRGRTYFSDESRKKMSDTRRGLALTEAQLLHLKKIQEAPCTDETKAKMRASSLNAKVKNCRPCGMSLSGDNLYQYTDSKGYTRRSCLACRRRKALEYYRRYAS